MKAWLAAHALKLLSAAVLIGLVANGTYKWIDVNVATQAVAILAGFGLLLHPSPQSWTTDETK